MKVDRVILVSNNNRMYSDFWNNLSYTYKIKFGIQPTLVFFGTESEKEILGLSENYGNIIYEKKNRRYCGLAIYMGIVLFHKILF